MRLSAGLLCVCAFVDLAGLGEVPPAYYVILLIIYVLGYPSNGKNKQEEKNSN